MSDMETRLSTLEKRVDRIEVENKSFEILITRMDKELSGLYIASEKDISKIFETLNKIEESTCKTNNEIMDLKMKPGKRFDLINDKIALVVVTIITTYIVTYLLTGAGLI